MSNFYGMSNVWRLLSFKIQNCGAGTYYDRDYDLLPDAESLCEPVRITSGVNVEVDVYT